MDSTRVLAVRPWRRALREERALPSGVRGPRESAPLAREHSILAIDDIYEPRVRDGRTS